MAILLSHKQAVTYIEYAKIVKADERVGIVKESAGCAKTFSLPYGNMAVLLLGPGTSITQSAMHHLCSEGVLVGFTGGEGYPIFCGSLSEYRPTEYAQAWIQKWSQSPAWQLNVARLFQRQRVDLVNKTWASYDFLPPSACERAAHAGTLLIQNQARASSKEDLLGFEAVYAKALYAALSHAYAVPFTRAPKAKPDLVNKLIDSHNYYAYGIAGAVLWTLGIPFAFPVLHGNTRRGALVFDVADIIKDGILLPLAFESAKSNTDTQKHKKICADKLHLDSATVLLFTALKKALGIPIHAAPLFLPHK